MIAASWSARMALPSTAIDVNITITSATVRNCLHRQRAAQLEHGPRDHRQHGHRRGHAGQDPGLEPVTEGEHGLVEEHGLEPLAVHGGEADERERGRRTDRGGLPHPGLQELHPPALVEARDQPERHVEEHDHGRQPDDRLEHLSAERQHREERRRPRRR